MLEIEQQRLRNVFIAWLDRSLCGALGWGRIRQTARWETEVKKSPALDAASGRGIRLSLGNSSTTLDIWGWKTNNRHNSGHLGSKKEWKTGEWKREKMGKGIKEERGKRQQERKETEKLVGSSPEYFLPIHRSPDWSAYPWRKWEGTKLLTHNCVAHRYSQVKCLGRYTHF